MKISPPFGKGGQGGILRTNASFYDYKISPNPSLPKRGIFGSMIIIPEKQAVAEWAKSVKMSC
jgi:hypothetical protein